jgi:acyl carrier protein
MGHVILGAGVKKEFGREISEEDIGLDGCESQTLA